MATRNGSARWHGDLSTGSGTVTVGDDVWTSNYSYSSRFADGQGTNPEELIAELAGYVPQVPVDPEHIGFAVPLRLATVDGELHLITTLTSFATATDITLAELTLEAFLPADQNTADLLRRRAGRRLNEGDSRGDT